MAKGLFGWLGEAVNSITSPIAGIEFFPGGTLSDDTADAMSKEARQAQATNRQQWDWLGEYGKQLLRIPTAGGMQAIGGTPAKLSPRSDTDAARQAAAGNVSLADIAGRYMSNLDALASGSDALGYKLTPNQQKLLNQTLGALNVQRAKAIDSARRALAARGIVSGSMYDNTLRRIADHYDQQVLELGTQFAEQARKQRMQDQYQYLQQLMSQIAQGTGMVAQSAAGQRDWTSYLQQQAAAKQAEEAAGANRLADFLGTLASGAFSGSGAPWSVGGWGKAGGGKTGVALPQYNPPPFAGWPFVQVPQLTLGGGYNRDLEWRLGR